MNATPKCEEHQLTDKGYVPVYTTAVVEQPWASYSASDHTVWATLFERQQRVLVGRASDEFLRNQRAMGMSPDRIPKFDDLNRVLRQTTGWELVGVEGLLPELTFFDHLAHRRFPLAPLDFAPAASKTGCNATPTWILAAAPGLVVRSGNGIVVVDLDGDGKEQTGWNLMYLHVAGQDRVAKGQWVEANDRIGHASCEGGISTGTHLHFARKYNGEWITADGPVPFVLSGWTAVAGEKPYEGKLVKGNRVITADLYGQLRALIYREDDGE